MAENENGRHLLAESDFVDVVDAEGNDLPSVPKHWGADQLPAGAKKKSSRSSSKSSSGSSGGSGGGDSTPDPNAEPSRGASTDAWVTYATDVKGAKPEDLVDEQGEPLKRDALVAKFGTPAE